MTKVAAPALQFRHISSACFPGRLALAVGQLQLQGLVLSQLAGFQLQELARHSLKVQSRLDLSPKLFEITHFTRAVQSVCEFANDTEDSEKGASQRG